MPVLEYAYVDALNPDITIIFKINKFEDDCWLEIWIKVARFDKKHEKIHLYAEYRLAVDENGLSVNVAKRVIIRKVKEIIVSEEYFYFINKMLSEVELEIEN